MAEYRTPEEEQAQGQHDARVRAVLDKAVHDGASCMVAMTLGESPEVVERWIDAIWDGLREALSDDRPSLAGGSLRQEDRLAAIVLLLDERMTAEATAVLAGLRNAGGAPC
jgi:hypothetical protein